MKGSGSSPRLWGTQHRHGGLGRSTRFIPTPVGNTITAQASATLSSVHPHACGEHCGLDCGQHHGIGSSPRLWGTPFGIEANLFQRLVHPHACGEH